MCAIEPAVQHLTDFRFLPALPAFSTFSMYSEANGTLHVVPCMSTWTLPSRLAVALARAVSGSTFEGMGTFTAEGKTSREHLRLVYMGDGVFYIPKVAHNELPIAFRQTSEAGAMPVVFENPAHDFPDLLER